MFQQASEKANKALALFLEIIDEKDLQKLNHDQLKPFKNQSLKAEAEAKLLINQMSSEDNFLSKLGIDKELITNHSLAQKEHIKFIDSLRNADLINLTVPDLNRLLSIIRNSNKQKLTVKTNRKLQFDFKIKFLDVINALPLDIESKKSLRYEIETTDLSKQLLLSTIQVVETAIPITSINTTFYTCAILTIKHSSLSRYPSENGLNPNQIYLKKLPIIKKQLDFMLLLNEAIDRLESIISKGK